MIRGGHPSALINSSIVKVKQPLNATTNLPSTCGSGNFSADSSFRQRLNEVQGIAIPPKNGNIRVYDGQKGLFV
jgi:hypothetical protein